MAVVMCTGLCDAYEQIHVLKPIQQGMLKQNAFSNKIIPST